METNKDILNWVAKAMETCGENYELRRDRCSDRFYYFILETGSTAKKLVQVDVVDERVWLRVKFPIDQALVEKKEARLLQTSNNISNATNLNAKLLRDALEILCFIHGSGPSMEVTLENALRDYKNVESKVMKVLFKALHSKDEINPFAYYLDQYAPEKGWKKWTHI